VGCEWALRLKEGGDEFMGMVDELAGSIDERLVGLEGEHHEVEGVIEDELVGYEEMANESESMTDGELRRFQKCEK
jgi:hypothetical protein